MAIRYTVTVSDRTDIRHDGNDLPIATASKDYATQRGADSGAVMTMRRRADQPTAEPQAGDVMITTKGRKIKLVAPVTQEKNGLWCVPGYRWIESRRKFSSILYSHSSKEAPRLHSRASDVNDG